jgi:small-conductance mechanosensitive channel
MTLRFAALLVTALLSSSAVAQAPPTVPLTGEDLAQKDPGAVVRFRNEALLTVHAPAATLSVTERAAAIEQRILVAAEGSSASLQTLRSIDRGTATDVMIGDAVVVSIRDADAAPAGQTREALATTFSDHLRDALARDFNARTLRSLLVSAGYAALATLILVLLLLGVRALFPRLEARLAGWKPHWIPTLQLGSVSLLSAARVASVLRQLARALRFAIVLVALIAWANTVLSFFPWTRGFSHDVARYVLTAVEHVALRLIRYVPNLVYIALIVLVARWILRLLKLAADELKKGTLAISGFHNEWAEPTYKIVRLLVVALAAVAAFPYLPGSKSPAFQGISIFLGVLLSLGSSSAIGNIIAGVAMTYMRPFALGDRVKIDDTVGDVMELGLLVVRIRTVKNEEITIANSMVLGNHIVNYSAGARQTGLILHTSVTIGYDAPWRQVHELLIAAARATEGLEQEPAPFVLQTALDDFYVSYEINAVSRSAHQMQAIYSRLHAQIQDTFNAAGVEIMSSHYLNLRDGNTVTIPGATKLPGYDAPRFRVDATKND